MKGDEKKRAEKIKRRSERRKNNLSAMPPPPELQQDEEQQQQQEDRVITLFRQYWESLFAQPGRFSFHDTTFPSMQYTFGRIPRDDVGCDKGVQLFSAQFTKLLPTQPSPSPPQQEQQQEGVEEGVHVYGLVALRDWLDQKRNIVFNRSRDDCQIITRQDPFLVLTGPCRAVSLLDPVLFEIQLKAKTGGDDPERDQILNFDVLSTGYTYLWRSTITVTSSSKRSELEFTYSVLEDSLEATISAELLANESHHFHLRPRIVARTSSIPRTEIVLLDSRRTHTNKIFAPNSYDIQLSRRVVSVELKGQLIVDVFAYSSSNDAADAGAQGQAQVVFSPKETCVSAETCDLGFCKLKISVAWSLINSFIV